MPNKTVSFSVESHNLEGLVSPLVDEPGFANVAYANAAMAVALGGVADLEENWVDEGTIVSFVVMSAQVYLRTVGHYRWIIGFEVEYDPTVTSQAALTQDVFSTVGGVVSTDINVT